MIKTKKSEKKETISTMAKVMNGKYEIRTYSLKEHGENFAELANEFASKKGYQVELA